MSLKKLSQFQVFDSKAFFESKDFLLSKIEEWQEQDEGSQTLKNVGTKVTGVIFVDKSNYGSAGTGINKGESITFKVSQPVTAFSNWQAFNTVFKATDFTKVSVYGEYRNQLSVRVPDLTAVRGAGAAKKA
jgi:hypothetical protein